MRSRRVPAASACSAASSPVTIRRLAASAAALAVLGTAPAVSASGLPACAHDKDRSGDGWVFIGGGPLPSDPALDILSGRVGVRHGVLSATFGMASTGATKYGSGVSYHLNIYPTAQLTITVFGGRVSNGDPTLSDTRGISVDGKAVAGSSGSVTLTVRGQAVVLTVSVAALERAVGHHLAGTAMGSLGLQVWNRLPGAAEGGSDDMVIGGRVPRYVDCA